MKEGLRHFGNKAHPEELYDYIQTVCEEREIKSFSRTTFYKYLKDSKFPIKKILHDKQDVEYQLIEKEGIESRIRKPFSLLGRPGIKILKEMNPQERHKMIFKILSAWFIECLREEFTSIIFPLDKDHRKIRIGKEKNLREMISLSTTIEPKYTRACLIAMAEYHKIVN